MLSHTFDLLIESAHPLLEAAKFCGGKRVGFADGWDNVHARGKATHELNVHLTKSGN